MLTAQQKKQYAAWGITYPIPVLSAGEAQHFRQACDDLEVCLGGRPRTIEVRQMHLHFRWAYELAAHPRILDAVADLLGPDLLIWATELFAKHPHDKTVSIRWHQDMSYLGFDPRLTTTAWIALCESSSANGCMRAAPKSKRRNPSTPDLNPINPDEIVDVELRAGEMSLHDAEIVHGSGPNLSASKRVGFVVRYVTPEAHGQRAATPVMLARGQDRFGHFPLTEPPVGDQADAVGALRVSAQHHLDAILRNLRHAET